MKEIIAIIRMDMINKTKEKLLMEGFPALHCRKVMGRGKKKVDFSVIEDMLSGSEIPSRTVVESISEGHKLIPKRLISLVVKDYETKKAIDAIIDINSFGKPGDGKIFVMPINDAIRIRTGETGEEAV